MKTGHILSFAALCAIASTASAQSSVALIGTIDLNARYVKTDGQGRRLSENTSGLNSGQFGVIGEEDLGGGLKAGFILLSENVADTGNAGANTKFWNRQSVVRLWSPLGELRLGRDYTPTYLSYGTYDVFGNVGIGSMLNIHQIYPGTRNDNSISYALPGNLGGVNGRVMVAAAEGGTTLDRPGRYIGARIGYTKGPIDVGVGFGQERFAISVTGITAAPFTGSPVLNNGPLVAIAAGATQKTFNVGASYDFSVVKLYGLFDREQVSDKRQNLYSIGAAVPIGLGQVRATYNRSTLTPGAASATAPSTTLDQITLGYVYNLSKRTALYTTVSRLDNKDDTSVTLPSSAGKATPGGESQGVEFGIRHFF